MREIVTSEKPKPDYSWHPCLWFCLDENSQYALEAAYKRATDYHKKLIPPGQQVDVITQGAAREMRQVPTSENHMRADA